MIHRLLFIVHRLLFVDYLFIHRLLIMFVCCLWFVVIIMDDLIRCGVLFPIYGRYVTTGRGGTTYIQYLPINSNQAMIALANLR